MLVILLAIVMVVGMLPSPTLTAFAATAESDFASDNGTITSYTVTVDTAIENGDVTPDKESATKGDIVTLTVTPASGYAIDTVKYNDGTTDTIVTTTEGVYAFTMTGGEIKNNTVVNCGGAVFINKNDTRASNATFKLQGGSITGNTAKYGAGIYISAAKLLELCAVLSPIMLRHPMQVAYM